MAWWCLPACPARANRRWDSARSTRRRSGGISNPSRPMRGVCFIRWRFPRLTKSMACPRPWPCSSSAGRPPRALPSAVSRRCPTCFECCTRAPASIQGTSPGTRRHAAAEVFPPNPPGGACPRCHGLGRVYEVTERSMVPDDSKSIRERAIAAWPPAWHGGNLRDMLTSLGYDVDRPWRELPKKTRDWILFTDEQPVVPVYIGYDTDEARRAIRRKEEPSYRGNFSGARRY